MPSMRSKVSAVAANAVGMSAAAPKRWKGVDPAMERMVLRTCLDKAPERRDVLEAFKDMQLSIDHCLFKDGSACAISLRMSTCLTMQLLRATNCYSAPRLVLPEKK